MIKSIMFRVDGGGEIGIGHVMRCITLANQFSNMNVKCDFFCKKHDEKLIEKIESNGYRVFSLVLVDSFESEDEYGNWLASTEEDDANACVVKAGEAYYDLAIVDHYGISSIWEKIIYKIAKKILVIDDLTNRSHFSDFILNSLDSSSRIEYKDLSKSNTKFFIGNKYALIRPEFFNLRSKAYVIRKNTTSVNNIFISFGGTDPEKLSLVSLNALLDFGFKGEISVMISSCCHWLEELTEYCQKLSSVTLLIDEAEPAKYMLGSDFSIGSSGGTALERCVLGLPSLVVCFSENQKKQADYLCREGAVKISSISDIRMDIKRTLEIFNIDFSSTWRNMSLKSFCALDGMGAKRLSLLLSKDWDVNDLYIDTAKEDDLITLFIWQKDSGTRVYFKNPKVPSFKEHVSWFHRVMLLDSVDLWIVKYEGISCGYIRLDEINDSQEVSVFVDPIFQGKGIASWMLRKIIEFSKYDVLTAVIHSENESSIRLFKNAGYREVDNNRYYLDISKDNYVR